MPAPVLDPDIWEDVVRAALSSWLCRSFEHCNCDVSLAHAGRCSKHVEFLWRKRFKEDLVTEFVKAEPWLAKADRLRLRELMVLALEAHGYTVLLANTSSSKARVAFPDGTQHRVTGIAMGIVARAPLDNSPLEIDADELISGFASQLDAQHEMMMPWDPMNSNAQIGAMQGNGEHPNNIAAPRAQPSYPSSLEALMPTCGTCSDSAQSTDVEMRSFSTWAAAAAPPQRPLREGPTPTLERRGKGRLWPQDACVGEPGALPVAAASGKRAPRRVGRGGVGWGLGDGGRGGETRASIDRFLC